MRRATPPEVMAHSVTGRKQRCNKQKAICQARLSIREGEYGLVGEVDTSGAAFIGCHALVLAKNVTAQSLRRVIRSLLKPVQSGQ